MKCEMKQELQLKLQAYLDGELPDGEAREVADLLARDAEASGLVAELKNTRGALAVFESETKLPESREFYWSKIQREIERRLPGVEPERKFESSFAFFRRMLVPACAAAVLVIVGLVATREKDFIDPRGLEVKTEFADGGALTYRDHAQGLTLVWLPYPAESESALPDIDDIL